MSVDLTVYLCRGKMPSPIGWAEAIRATGLVVDFAFDDFDVDTQTGYLPCRVDGAESGFEYFSGALTEDERAELEVPSFDFDVTFTTHSDLREFEVAVIAAAVLAHETAGVLYEPYSGETFQPDDALKWAREQLAEIRKLR